MSIDQIEPEHRAFFEEKLAQDIRVIAAARADDASVIVGNDGLTIIWRGRDPRPGRGLFSVSTPWWMIADISAEGRVLIRGEDRKTRELTHQIPLDFVATAQEEWRSRLRHYSERRNLRSQAFLQESLQRLHQAVRSFIRDRGLRDDDVVALSHAAAVVPVSAPRSPADDPIAPALRREYSALLLYRDPDSHD